MILKFNPFLKVLPQCGLSGHSTKRRSLSLPSCQKQIQHFASSKKNQSSQSSLNIWTVAAARKVNFELFALSQIIYLFNLLQTKNIKLKSTIYTAEKNVFPVKGDRTRVEPSYRFFLNEGAHLGQYHLPLGLVVRSMHPKWNHSMGQSWLSQPIISP